MAKVKKTKSAEVVGATSAPEDVGVLYCEATGKKIKLKSFDPKALLEGDVRVFASKEVGQAHLAAEQKKGVILVHVKTIWVDEKQNTRRYSKKEADFLELIESIKVNGVLQPLTVVRSLDKAPHSYKLVAGYRRMAAARVLELTHVPIRVIPLNTNAKVISLLENLQRENPSPMEVATTVQAIINEGITDSKSGKWRKLSQREAARILGMGQSRLNDLLHVAGNLHEEVQKQVMDGDLPISKAAILAQLPPDQQVANLPRAKDMDNKALRSHVQDVRAELGDASTRGEKAKSNRKTTSSGVKYSIRPVGLLVDLLESMWRRRIEGDKAASLRAQIILLQFCLSLIPELDAGMADLDAMREASKKGKKPAKKRGAKAKEEEAPKKAKKKVLVGKPTLPKVRKS